MAVERMQMMNLIALKPDAHSILREIVLDGSVHITGSASASNFTLRYMDSQSKNFESMGVDIEKVKPYTSEKVFLKRKYKDLLENMFSFFDIKENELVLNNLDSLNYKEKLKILDKMSENSERIRSMEIENEAALENARLIIDAVEYFSGSNLKVSNFAQLKHIKYDIGSVSKSSWHKLKANYENIKALVIHLGTSGNSETVMILTPLAYQENTKYFLRSLSFEKVNLPDVDLSFDELISKKKTEIAELEIERNQIKTEKERFRKAYLQDLFSLYYRYKIIEKIEELESHMAQSENFVLFSGFVPESKASILKTVIEKASKSAVVYFSDDTEISSGFKIPTKLKNNILLRPFETLVKMYSIPDYKETDPTPFFAITYMILFGMMFGDVGQGLVICLTGFILSRKIDAIGEIIGRIGISSIVFGFLYGSVFGIEDMIPAIVIRPMEEVNTILLWAVALGVLMMIIAYFIGFKNLKARNDMANLYFDKNGISGFTFYMAFLILALNLVIFKRYLSINMTSILTIICVLVMVITSSLMFMKPKLAEKIGSKKIQEGLSHKEMFSPVESGFELFETLMGMFSNTLSFIRVGAFAINHVGLFMAFQALGQMTGSGAGNFIMIIVGNIIILGLEGLIVSIQSIRLEYYELFSKYFKGEGIDYEPVHVEIKTKV
ncbi:MAG: V-type ATP synthase subunit I [Filifactoraceae bacterium]